MRVSIVIPAYNASAFLGATLAGVRAQSFSDWECIVVDDGSSDSTSEIAANLCVADSRFHLIRQENTGAAGARNRGFAETDQAGEFVIFLDHDDVWLPDCLQMLVGALERDSEAVAAHALAYAVNAGEGCAGRVQRSIKNRERREASGKGSRVVAPSEPTTRRVLIWDNCITTTGLILIRRSTLQQSGLFDCTAFPLDDWDLYFRIAAIGPIAYVGEPAIEWRVHESNTSHNQAWMDWATCLIRQRMLACADLTTDERDCVKRRLRRMMRSAYRHAAGNASVKARQSVKTGRPGTGLLLYVSAAVDYARYLWLGLFWRDEYYTRPVAPYRADAAQALSPARGMRILIIKMWALGDVLMATPILTRLKMLYPDCAIDWMIEESHADVLQGNPMIERIIAFDSTSWRCNLKRGRVIPYFSTLLRLRRQLRDRRYDLAINLTGDKNWTNALLCAPRALGLFRSEPGPLVRRRYEHIVVRDKQPRGRHNTLTDLDVLAPLGEEETSLQMVAKSSRPLGDRIVRLIELASGAPVVVFSPFSTAENRNWPDERSVELCRWLASERGCIVAINSSPQNAQRVAAMASACRSERVLALTDTTLEHYKQLIEVAQLVICTDSSAMHLAAALGTPYLALFGATPIDERKPLVGYGIAVHKPLPCAPCDRSTCRNAIFRQCMLEIELSDVQAAVTEALRTHSPGEPGAINV